MPAENQKQTLYYFSVASGPDVIGQGKVLHWGPYLSDCPGQLVEKQYRYTFKTARFDAKRLAKAYRCESIYYHGRDEVIDPAEINKQPKVQRRRKLEDEI
jgi:hypothetical protein